MDMGSLNRCIVLRRKCDEGLLIPNSLFANMGLVFCEMLQHSRECFPLAGCMLLLGGLILTKDTGFCSGTGQTGYIALEAAHQIRAFAVRSRILPTVRCCCIGCGVTPPGHVAFCPPGRPAALLAAADGRDSLFLQAFQPQ